MPDSMASLIHDCDRGSRYVSIRYAIPSACTYRTARFPLLTLRQTITTDSANRPTRLFHFDQTACAKTVAIHSPAPVPLAPTPE